MIRSEDTPAQVQRSQGRGHRRLPTGPARRGCAGCANVRRLDDGARWCFLDHRCNFGHRNPSRSGASKTLSGHYRGRELRSRFEGPRPAEKVNNWLGSSRPAAGQETNCVPPRVAAALGKRSARSTAGGLGVGGPLIHRSRTISKDIIPNAYGQPVRSVGPDGDRRMPGPAR
jgi:hypothetical protein